MLDTCHDAVQHWNDSKLECRQVWCNAITLVQCNNGTGAMQHGRCTSLVRKIYFKLFRILWNHFGNLLTNLYTQTHCHGVHNGVLIMKKAISGNLVQFTFDGCPGITFDITKVSAENRAYAALFGFQSRLGDAAALSREKAAGNTITEAMRRDAVNELVSFYHDAANKDWALRATSSKAPAINPVWQAIATKRGITYEAYMEERVAKDLAELAELNTIPE